MADISPTAAVLATNAVAAGVQQGSQFMGWLLGSAPLLPMPGPIIMILVAWLLPIVHAVYSIIMVKLQSMSDAKAGSRRSTDQNPSLPTKEFTP